MKITVCIGSSCHLKGSHAVVERIKELITENKLSDKIDLGGTFCMGNCEKGVSVTVDGKLFSVPPQSVDDFFEKEVKANL